MILPVRARLIVFGLVLALAGTAAIVLLPKLERTVAQIERIAHSPHGIAGGLVQRLLTSTSTSSARPAHPPARPVAVPVLAPPAGAARRVSGAARRSAPPASASAERAAASVQPRPAAGSGVGWWLLFAPVAVLVVLVLASAGARLWFRRCRVHMPYRILVSGHDRLSPRRVVAALGTMGESVSAPVPARVLRGQAIFGVQLDYDPRGGGVVIPLLFCEPRHVRALDAALQQAYPNARVGFAFKPPFEPCGRSVWRPRVVWRLRKAGDPIYPLYDAVAEEDLGPPLESVATSLHGLGEGTRTRTPGQFASVRIAVLAGNRTAAYLRERHRRKERTGRLAEQIARGQHAPASSVDAQQARQSVQLSEHALFHAEVQIAADDEATCKRLAGALLRYPGMNTLTRRNMIVREGLYRRRWTRFAPPLVMRGPGKVMSAAELGYLVRLPSGDLTVPIERAAQPRRAAGHGEQRGRERGAPLPAGEREPAIDASGE